MAIPFVPNHSPCMLKLDRLPWKAGFSFLSYGVRMGFRTTDAEVLPTVRELMPPGFDETDDTEVEQIVSFQVGGTGPRPGQRRFHLVNAQLTRLCRTHDRDAALHTVEAATQLLVALNATDRIFLHAGVVGWRGRAILIPGRSFAGKSRLVAALLEAGAEYYSDEYAVVDERGLVHPYPRRLSLRDGDGSPRLRSTAEDHGSRTGTEPLPVGLVAFARYREGVDWSPRELSKGKAGLGLLDNAIAARYEPEQCLAAIERVLSAAQCLAGNRGDAAEAAEALLAACDRAA